MAPFPDRKTAPLFAAQKGKQLLVVVTAYDAPQGRLADGSGVDALLVGDSVAMTTHGYDSTLPVTLDDMIHHTRAVARGQNARILAKTPVPEELARGARRALLIADLPFGSYGATVEDGVRAGMRLAAEGGAQAIKIEGASPLIRETIRRLIDVGIPVMGHLGLTPQSVHRFGGFRLQARTIAAADTLLSDAVGLCDDGVFGMVLELIPEAVAARVTEAVPMPTIGIGAGRFCDGQVQVLHDLTGLGDGPVFRHARRYVDVGTPISRALAEYAADVRERRFPTAENSF